MFDEVAVAFHQGEPGFDSVLDEVSADEVTVVPLLTSAGHYNDVVLPDALARNRRHAEVRLRQTPPVGTHSGIAPLVARRVTEILRDSVIERNVASLVIVGHGTPRHPESRTSTLRLAEILRRRRVAGEVLAGFLDDEPTVEQALLQAKYSTIIVVPFLIGGGSHTLEDLPKLATSRAGARVIVDRAVGSYAGLDEIVLDLARRHTPPPPRFRPRGGGPFIKRPTGAVHLVGGGPGDPGLITARGLKLLQGADVVVHDRLIGAELLHEARAGAELIDVGKGAGLAPYSQDEINAILVHRARPGRIVVRLKGGDPFVFGRGSEEAAACREAGVEVFVVPGVSSAVAAPAAAGIPVTARGLARSFAVVTAQTADGRPSWRGLVCGGHDRRADGAGGAGIHRGTAHRRWTRSADAGRLHSIGNDAGATGHPRDPGDHRGGGRSRWARIAHRDGDRGRRRAGGRGARARPGNTRCRGGRLVFSLSLVLPH